jgi:FtsP/CotA-like multicopper oxidase with cupredoxin domain
MKPIRPTSGHLRGLSRRDFLWTGNTSFVTGLLSPVLVGLAVKQGRGESAMNMQGHAEARRIGVPRTPYQRGAPLIEPKVRRSVNGEPRTTLQIRYAYKDIGGRIPLGAVEEWTIVNEHEDDHVFHIHTNPFQMVAINGEKLADRDWRDSVVVPRKGSVTFRSRFLDFTGRFVHHCHMMNHEELGMMQVVEVDGSSTGHVSATNVGAVKAPTIQRSYPCKRPRQSVSTLRSRSSSFTELMLPAKWSSAAS